MTTIARPRTDTSDAKVCCERCQYEQALTSMDERIAAILSLKDLNALVASNDVPTEAEVESLIPYTSELESLLSTVTDLLNSASGTMAVLDSQSDLTTEWIKNAKFVSHPVRKLTDDIILEIFNHCDLGEATEIPNAPWTLSHVSSQWRRVALKTPQLWTSVALNSTAFCFEEYGYTKASRQNRLNTLSACLSRSKSLPLKVTIKGANKPTLPNSGLEMLVGEAHRWTHLSLFCDVAVVEYLEKHVRDLPALQEVSIERAIHAPSSSLVEYKTSSPSLFYRAPQLYSVHFPKGMCITEHDSLPWTQLRKISLKGNVTDLQKIVQLCPNLETLDMVTLYGFFILGPSAVTKVPQLKHLKLRPQEQQFSHVAFDVSDNFDSFLKMFSFPSLESFYLDYSPLDPEFVPEVISAPTVVDMPSLKRLTVDYGTSFHVGGREMNIACYLLRRLRVEMIHVKAASFLEEGLCQFMGSLGESHLTEARISSEPEAPWPESVHSTALRMLETRKERLCISWPELPWTSPQWRRGDNSFKRRLKTLLDRRMVWDSFGTWESVPTN